MTHFAADPPPQLIAFLDRHRIDAEFVAPGVAIPTVERAAAAIGVPEEHILKTLLFSSDGEFVIAIANGTKRVNRRLLSEASGLLRPRAASPDVVQKVTGYPAGGVAPVGLPQGLAVIVESAVALLPLAYGGGGREHLLLKIAPADVIRSNRALVARIVED